MFYDLELQQNKDDISADRLAANPGVRSSNPSSATYLSWRLIMK